MSDEAISIVITGKINGQVAKSIRDIAKAALEADTNLDMLRQALQGFSASTAISQAASQTRTLRNEVKAATGDTKALATASNSVATAMNRAASAAGAYDVRLKQVNTSTKAVSASTGNLRGLLGTVTGLFGGIFAITGYARAQDALTNIQNKIRGLTSDLERQRDIQGAIFDLALRTRAGVEGATDAFVRFSKAMKGASDGEVLRFIETLNKQLLVAGRTTTEVNSIVIQLGQALTSGRLMGDEFRSLSENLPREALEEIARVLGTNVDALKEMSTQGLITTDVLKKAFANMADSADEAFKRTVPTISQALENLNTRFIAFTSKTSAGANLVASSIEFIGKNLNIIIPIVGTLAAAFALVKFSQLVIELGLLAAALAPTTVAVGAFTLGLVGGAAAAYLLAEAIAFITGKQEELTGWVQSTQAGLQNLIGSLGAYVQKAVGVDEITTSMQASTEALQDTYEAAQQAAIGIQTFSGGRPGVVDLNGAIGDVNASLGETAPRATAAAGAVLSMSGQYNGVINVAKALEQMNGGLTAVNDNAQVTVTRLNSISGQYNGVMRIASAFQAVANAAASASDNVRQLASEQAAASGRNFNPNNPVPRPGDSKGSYTNITGNNSANSFTKLPAYNTGGSFRVGGKPGVDRNLVAFRASKGERVNIETNRQQRDNDNDNDSRMSGPPVYNFYIETPDADSFKRSRNQIANDMFASLGG